MVFDRADAKDRQCRFSRASENKHANHAAKNCHHGLKFTGRQRPYLSTHVPQ